ncbi:hypothetical protein AB0E69_22850 [Kribbella sp. NPDC026611]|uniref:hypothetical protein n=1 Tax=Kribbella sp. NPDC026611 TaxID=3154911 RepID=UPI0033BFC1F7
MNPTDEVDDLLTRAGARWRADQGPAPEPDLDYRSRRPRRWVPALVAASVAVIGAGLLTVLPNHDSTPKPAVVAPAAATQQLAQDNQVAPDNDALLVKPGDKVRVTGKVIAAPGKTPVYCPQLVDPLIGYAPGKEPAPTCTDQFAIRLNGVNLDGLTDPKVVKGVRTGTATLTGIWHDHTIDVQQQSAPIALPPVNRAEPNCPAPVGGWKPRPSNINSAVVTNFLAAHADQIDGPILRYPDGSSRNAPVVVMIGVAHGDPAVFRQAFEQVYHGNLCIAPVLLSRNDAARVTGAVGDLMSRRDLGIISSGGPGLYGGPASVAVVVYTPELKTALAPIGLDLLRIEASVRPVN